MKITKLLESGFIRYIIIGSIAFIIDFMTIIICRNIIYPTTNPYIITLYYILGFILAFIFNYLSTLKYVFINYESNNQQKDIFNTLIVAIIGLVLTLLLMYIGEFIFKYNYVILKVIVSIIVLVWNYLARKYLIYK
ncbi:GtrA family protein [Mycoplasma sp. P36-A1]|uniref:GtrA family protein n=1 Tax=Mycoplasma sp. P36-A1 TaxID=3252900 RepID=UPI003C2F603B